MPTRYDWWGESHNRTRRPGTDAEVAKAAETKLSTIVSSFRRTARILVLLLFAHKVLWDSADAYAGDKRLQPGDPRHCYRAPESCGTSADGSLLLSAGVYAMT